MRLIDADKLLEETIKDRDYAEKNGFLDMYYERQVLIDRIKSQPTAYDVAINALEKQMQKKVKYEDVGYDQYNNVNVYACICPSCGLEIIRFNDNDISDKCESGDTEEMFHSSMVHHAYIGLNNYCNRCGQKLNWESDGE